MEETRNMIQGQCDDCLTLIRPSLSLMRHKVLDLVESGRETDAGVYNHCIEKLSSLIMDIEATKKATESLQKVQNKIDAVETARVGAAFGNGTKGTLGKN